MSRFGGRFLPNIEHEVRRQATEPIGKWRQEWVVPTGTLADGSASSSSVSANVGVKILKWVRVPDENITFPEEQDVLAEDRIADDKAIVEVPVQSIHNAPAVDTPGAGGSLSSAGGGLGTIAPKEPSTTPAPAAEASTTTAATAAQGSDITPASAIPAHVTSTFSEPTSSFNTTADNTPTDSVANTPAPSAPESLTNSQHQPPHLSQALSSQGGESTGTGGNTPTIQPQVESQLHDQPILGQQTDNATLAVLAAGAEAEQQPAAREETMVSTDPNASVPATTFEDETATAGASAPADVDMKDA
ncbi:hypothetical protein EX895_001041 [Sporisorium graminicola]|uniref:Uncharacterized protein n=1 Tax=Sporisorium graminicola TaxID=280036 RepID=A0A4U7L663_9BASI|nr:hypothetical protein EX895_001041 [Sporisorium graminicola]TKY91042.1 hypothetical protein EX895_001041 [Sporisorium graminicola]